MLKTFAAIFFICLGSLSAQTFINKLNPFPEKQQSVFSGDTLRILAVTVSFAPDKDGLTSGTGKFGTNYSSSYGDTIIDPLPHDKSYFDAHLEFVKNYYNKVSNGKLNIVYNILPDTFSVSQAMRAYSPPNSGNDFQLLADFSNEVWTLADQKYSGFDFSSYDVFIIFHAGVGRDVSLPGSIGNEKDLPSVYLSPTALSSYGYNGIPVSGGSFKITNSMIIPETESRELESLGQTYLFELSINGLLTASIASYLGLPDLFDTQTGLSAIGRFGLMDGQSIFAYNGVFPPEPSAWEKIYLGWQTPATLAPGSYSITLAAKETASLNDTTILKVPINSSEYYLVEDRYRDARNNGAVITYKINDSYSTKTFLTDSTGFYSFDISALQGVVTDVDEFDWALPGLVNDTAGYKGGIVIWHIDNNVINEKIDNNRINADINNRGVDVEEADGVQDIGVKYTTILGDEVVGEGTYEDYWYSGNNTHFYTNRFAKDTRPNTNSNSGANSLITFSNFSASANKMSFNLVYGDSVIKPVFASKVALPSLESFLTTTELDPNFYLVNGTDLRIIDSTGAVTATYPSFSKFKVAKVSLHLVGAADSSLNVLSYDVNNGYQLTSYNTGRKITSAPVRIPTDLGSEAIIMVGTEDGGYYYYHNYGDIDTSFHQLTDEPVLQIASSFGYTCYMTSNKVIDGRNMTYNRSDLAAGSQNNFTGGQIAVTYINNENAVVWQYDERSFAVLQNGKILSNFTVDGTGFISGFALADIRHDGNNYIIFADGDKLQAVNFSGASAENFPFVDPEGKSFTFTPVAADFEGTNSSEVIGYTEDGRIYAIDGSTGKVVAGFPISAGNELLSVPAFYHKDDVVSFAALTQYNPYNFDGSSSADTTSANFFGWKFGSTYGNVYWGQKFADGSNSSYTSAATTENYVNQFFPKNKVYNYPNPVYNGSTAIRYYVSENSKINIKIFDLAGDFVAELNADAQGGLDNETIWDVSGIQSGIYLARIEAAGTSGKTESNIIKIAVVK